MAKSKYPPALMQMFNFSPHLPIEEKIMVNNILSKCVKVYGSKYKIKCDLYNILNTHNNGLHSESESEAADYVFIRINDIRQFLRKLAIEYINKNNYVEVGSILSDRQIKYLEVLVV